METNTGSATSVPSPLVYLDQFQKHLHSIYGVTVPHAVSDFVTTDQSLVSALTNGDRDHIKEKLLVLENGENLDLSLYLHTSVVESLHALPLHHQLEPENLENLCLAIEGISHFLYLVWRAMRQHEVSLLELELQAEVDKYIVLLSLLLQMKKYNRIPDLHYMLFEAIRFDDALKPYEETRYRKANHYAGKYCRLFEREYLDEFGSYQMYSELRGFYRLGQNEKLRRIVNYSM